MLNNVVLLGISCSGCCRDSNDAIKLLLNWQWLLQNIFVCAGASVMTTCLRLPWRWRSVAWTQHKFPYLLKVHTHSCDARYQQKKWLHSVIGQTLRKPWEMFVEHCTTLLRITLGLTLWGLYPNIECTRIQLAGKCV